MAGSGADLPSEYNICTSAARATRVSYTAGSDSMRLLYFGDQVRIPAGSVLLWRPTTLHAVLKHTDPSPRKALHISYGTHSQPK